jgi:4-hydroxy-tetrahydrodipicolinate synthase
LRSGHEREDPAQKIVNAKGDAMLIIGRHVSRLSGYAPAVPTPFNEGGAVEFEVFERFCASQIEHGATALVVCGTTGEAPTLSAQEQNKLIRLAVHVAAGRVPVVAGAGSNATSHAIELSRAAESAGADAVLSVVPYYNKPTQAGLLAHFGAIAASTALPIILYDVPSRTGCGLAEETIARLAEKEQITGLKDATGDLSRLARLKSLVPSHFRLLSGDDATAPAYLAQGGHGCISVTSNVAPGLCRSLYLALRQDQTARAQRLAAPIAELTEVLFRETNPAPLKCALNLFGLMAPTLRLPLVEPSDKVQAEISAVMGRVAFEYSDQLIGSVSALNDHGRKAAVA